MSASLVSALLWLIVTFVDCTEYPLYAIVTPYYEGQKSYFTKQDIQIIAINFTRGQIISNSSTVQLFH